MTRRTKISLERVYDTPRDNSSARLLVDRIWPRGVSKEKLALDAWIKDVAPSKKLRQWFDHDPDKWGEFRSRYRHELADNRTGVEECLGWCRKGPVTLLFAARDRDRNQAVVLKEYLTECLKGAD